jgi:hypothetical protein
MGAMKAIYTDIQELQCAASGDEDSFITYIEEMGWVSPSEKEARTFQASKLVMDMSPEERSAVSRVLSAVGFHIPAIDFPIRTSSTMPAVV